MPFCITFAGCIGSSKTPIAHFLSAAFSLPIHDNDAIRTEVTEDLGHFEEQEYLKRRDERLKALIEQKTSFICAASIDRQWGVLKPRLQAFEYDWFVISLDWSKDLLERLYRAKKYDDAPRMLDRGFSEHEAFLASFGQDVALRLADDDFLHRLERSRAAVEAWLAGRN